MIPTSIALLGYIPFAALIMMDRNGARGFSIAYAVGLFFLPPNFPLNMPGIPDMGKDNVWAIGILLGTLIFHPGVFDRFKPNIGDYFLLGVLLVAFSTSIANGFGAYDGMSQTAEFTLAFVLPVFLARLHLSTPASIKTFLVTLCIGAAAYAPLAAWEFRMSPQIHTTVYGYFQHVFQQHARGSFWRPIVFFSHALALARFFAFTAFLAMLPLRKDLTRMLGPVVGKYLFVAPLLGLIISQSLGPMIMFGCMCAGYYVYRHRPRLAYVLPVVGFVWLTASLVGLQPRLDYTSGVDQYSADRADSFQYRLDALSEYSSVIMNKPLLGHGGWDHGRIEGRATDSQALISLLFRGWIGSAFYFAWWFYGIYVLVQIVQRSRQTMLGAKATGLLAMASFSIALTVIDAGFDQHVAVVLAASMGIHSWLSANPQIPTLANYQSRDIRVTKPLSWTSR